MLQPTGGGLDPVADGQGGKHDGQVGFNGVALAAVDRPGLQVPLGRIPSARPELWPWPQIQPALPGRPPLPRRGLQQLQFGLAVAETTWSMARAPARGVHDLHRYRTQDVSTVRTYGDTGPHRGPDTFG
jgi:hypothetical protein